MKQSNSGFVKGNDAIAKSESSVIRLDRTDIIIEASK